MPRQIKYPKEPRKLEIAGEPLSKESFEKYKAQFGDDKANGYLSAVIAFNIEIAKILEPGYNGNSGAPSSGTRVKKELEKLFNHNEEFLIEVNGKGARSILYDLIP